MYYKSIKLTPEQKEFIEKKVEKLSQLHLPIINCQVDLSMEIAHRTANQARAEINAQTQGHLVRSVVHHLDIITAVEQAIDKCWRQLSKLKDKRDSRKS
jgi:ribosomal subunit interface protein